MFLSGVLLLNLAGVFLSVYKWQKLLTHDGLSCGYYYLLHLYFCGIFFNTFLPTSVGGDAVRGMLLTRKFRRPIVAVTSIFAERFSGLMAMFPLLAFGYLLTGGSLGLNLTCWGVVGMASLALIALIPCLLVLLRWVRLGTGHWMEKVNTAVSGLRGYLGDWNMVWTLTWSSLVFQVLAVGVYWFAGKAFNLHVDFAALLTVVPLVTLLTLLPISLNGLGLREGGMVFLLARFGVEGHDALALSLTVYGVSLVLALLGGISWVWGRPQSGFPEPN